MRLCYQVATPDVEISESVTAYQGTLEKSFGDLSRLGYDGVELMTRDPYALDWDGVRDTAKENNLGITLVCTGEVYGQLGLSFTDPDAKKRHEAIERVQAIIDFASHLNANVNIGRVRGQYFPGIAKEQTREWCAYALQELSDYAAPKRVKIALENVTIMQTNFINTMDEGHEMIKMVDRDNCAMMIDVFHLNLEEPNLYSAIQKYANRCIHVHLSDNNRRYPGNCGLDFKRIVKAFYEAGYCGDFCTEIVQQPSMGEAAAGAIRHLAPIFSEVYGRKIK